MIDVLIADDEEPALDALEFLLRSDPRIRRIVRAFTGSTALQVLSEQAVDAAFLDVHMPGLSGFDLARAVQRFAAPPAIVVVTADEETAVTAFDLDVTDYLLKPLRQERLARAISRIEAAAAPGRPQPEEDEVITVTRGSTIRRLRRSEVRYVQAQGDYARLHTDDDSFLLRIPMTDLCEQWAAAGFVRVHRSFLVILRNITSVRVGNSPAVTVGSVELPVSRRLLPALRDAFGSTRTRP